MGSGRATQVRADLGPPSMKHELDHLRGRSIRFYSPDQARRGASSDDSHPPTSARLRAPAHLRVCVSTTAFTNSRLPTSAIRRIFRTRDCQHTIFMITDAARRGEAFARSGLVGERAGTSLGAPCGDNDLANASPLQPHPLHPSSLKCLAPTTCALHPSSFIPHPSSCLAPTTPSSSSFISQMPRRYNLRSSSFILHLSNASPLQLALFIPHPSSLILHLSNAPPLQLALFIPHPSSLKCLAPTSHCPLPLSRFSRSLPSIAAQLILALPRRFSWLIGNWPIGSLPPAPSPYPLPHHKPMRARGFSRTIPTRMGFEPTEVGFALCCRGACPASLSGV